MKSKQKIEPPLWADRFLEWYCKTELLEEIQGDIHELFLRRVGESGLSNARRKYFWDVLRFFKWSNMRKRNSFKYYKQSAMINNYFKVGARNIKKQKLPSLINVSGLSIAVAITIISFLYIDWQFNLDHFHEHSHRIYQVTSIMERDGGVEEWSYSPEPLAPAMQRDISQIELASRINISTAVLRHEDQVFNELIHFVDPSFLDIFSFAIKKGNTKALQNPSGIVITEEIAEKYFNDQDPIGEEVLLTFGRSIKKSFEVVAVAENISQNASFGFNILLPYQVQKDLSSIYDDIEDWEMFNDAAFVLAKENTNVTEVSASMEGYRKLQNETGSTRIVKSFKFQPLEGLSMNNHEIRDALGFGNIPEGTLTLIVLSISILLLACFNYTNIAIVSASGRLKEIGLRKVIGGKRTEIITQFLLENILLCGLALIVGIGIAYWFLLPALNSLFSAMEIPFNFSSVGMLITVIGGILLITGLASGAYPALYISSFSATSIFRGKEKFQRKNILSKVLLTFQFFITFFTIVSSIVFRDAESYFLYKDWGYNKESVAVLPIDGKKHYQQLKNELQQHPDVKSISGSEHHFGLSDPITSITLGSENFQVIHFNVGYDYLDVMDMDLLKGRLFDKNRSSDKESIVINKSLAEELSWDNPIGQTLKYDSANYTVIGMVGDFHYLDFYEDIQPAFIRVIDEEDYNYLVASMNSTNTKEFEDYLQETWKRVEPDLPYEGFMQSNVFAAFFDNIKANVKLIGFISVVALVLSCMGLFGLISFTVRKKMKEFSVRKILGASVFSIAKSINKEYIWVLLVAIVLGVTLGYLVISNLLDLMFHGRAPVGSSSFIISTLMIIATVILTTSSQIFKIIRSNPVDSLRSE